MLAAAVGLAIVALVATAARLAPDKRGFGTHEQLGWPACQVRLWTGRPCPTCGMTTAWAHAVRGHVDDAFAASVGGVIGLAIAVVAAAWMLAAAVSGRCLVAQPRPRWILLVATGWLIVTLADWARRLVAG